MGGASPTAALQTAAMAIAPAWPRTCWCRSAGTATRRCDRAPTRAPTGAGSRRRSSTSCRTTTRPTGSARPPSGTRFYLSRYVKRLRRADRSAGAVALACRQHAQLNDKALMRGRADDDGRLPRVAVDLRAAAQARLLPRDRLRRRGRRHLGRAGQGPAAHRRCYAGRRRGPSQPAPTTSPTGADVLDARPPLRRAARLRHGRRQAAATSTSCRSTTASPTSCCWSSRRSASPNRGGAAEFVQGRQHRARRPVSAEHPRRAAVARATAGA